MPCSNQHSCGTLLACCFVLNLGCLYYADKEWMWNGVTAQTQLEFHCQGPHKEPHVLHYNHSPTKALLLLSAQQFWRCAKQTERGQGHRLHFFLPQPLTLHFKNTPQWGTTTVQWLRRPLMELRLMNKNAERGWVRALPLCNIDMLPSQKIAQHN